METERVNAPIRRSKSWYAIEKPKRKHHVKRGDCSKLWAKADRQKVGKPTENVPRRMV